MEELNFKSLKERWRSQTPVFWRKIQKVCVWLISLSVGTMGVNPALSAMGITLQAIPDSIVSLSAHVFGICTILGIATKFTVTDKLEIDDTKNTDNSTPEN